MLLETHHAALAPTAPVAPTDRPAGDPGAVPLRAARRQLGEQIARLESRLSDVTADAFPFGPVGETAVADVAARPAPRILTVGELEALRDDLAERLRRAHDDLVRRGAEHEHHRRRLQDMLARPRAHKWHRVARADIGEPGCGVWQVRPRLGLIGMLAGWWHVKLSSGCPLATAPRTAGRSRTGPPHGYDALRGSSQPQTPERRDREEAGRGTRGR